MHAEFQRGKDHEQCQLSQFLLNLPERADDTLSILGTHMKRPVPVISWPSQSTPQGLFYYILEFYSGLSKHVAEKLEDVVHPTFPYLFRGEEQILPGLKLPTTRWQQTLGFSPHTLIGVLTFSVPNNWKLRRKNSRKLLGDTRITLFSVFVLTSNLENVSQTFRCTRTTWGSY